ncbi:MAG: 23S rRNA (adenine(1618)-N(6))-methyltransferase RlmF [Rikenellaceae bacterium]
MSNRGELHPRNRHSGRYDMAALIAAYPALERYVSLNKYGERSISFFDPEAVKALNRALLRLYYNVEYWHIPASALTPPIPGRADYIHYAAELLGYPQGARCLDVGVGANCIYPIIGLSEYGWEFVGSDIDYAALKNAQKIIESNRSLKGRIELRRQERHDAIFRGVIAEGEMFDITICNPPFHDSAASAERGSLRKERNLKGAKGREIKSPTLNFGGKSNELWCEGGEVGFITRMIRESEQFSKNCRYFTTLVSKEESLKPLKRELEKLTLKEVRIIDMHQGQKQSRILAWRF